MPKPNKLQNKLISAHSIIIGKKKFETEKGLIEKTSWRKKKKIHRLLTHAEKKLTRRDDAIFCIFTAPEMKNVAFLFGQESSHCKGHAMAKRRGLRA